LPATTPSLVNFLVVSAILLCGAPAAAYLPCGADLPGTAIHGVSPKSNGDSTGSWNSCGGRDKTRNVLLYQCVEFVRRFFAERTDVNNRIPAAARPGSGWDRTDAIGFCAPEKASALRLQRFENGDLNASPPSAGDIVVFRQARDVPGKGFNTAGHIAIARSVGIDRVEVAEQNWGGSGIATLRFDRRSMTLTRFTDSSFGTRSSYDVACWLRPIADSCFPSLATPVIVAGPTEDYFLDGAWYTRYYLPVANRAQFPDALFEASPDLPPCGLNPAASRTWVELYNGSGVRVQGFCGFGSSSDLEQVWFAVRRGEKPPSPIYVTLWDRRCNLRHTSAPVFFP
jgi:hypothetical protein